MDQQMVVNSYQYDDAEVITCPQFLLPAYLFRTVLTFAENPSTAVLATEEYIDYQSSQ